MSGNSILSFTKAFNLLFGAKVSHAVAPYDSAESLGYAQTKLDRGVCPECDLVASISCIDTDADGNQTHMCGKCGAKFKFSDNGDLVNFTGYNPPIRDKFMRDIEREVESIRWQAAYTLDQMARKAA